MISRTLQGMILLLTALHATPLPAKHLAAESSETLVYATDTGIWRAQLVRTAPDGKPKLEQAVRLVDSSRDSSHVSASSLLSYSSKANVLAVENSFHEQETSARLWLLNVGTGETTTINAAKHASFSPDGKFICYTETGGSSSAGRVLSLGRGATWPSTVRSINGRNASFAPHGTSLMYGTIERSGMPQNTYVLDMATSTARLIRSKAYPYAWTHDGHGAILYRDRGASDSFEDTVYIVDCVTRAVLYDITLVGIRNVMLSARSHLVALESHLSRPLTGSAIIDIRTGEGLPHDYDVPGLAPWIAFDWSPNDKMLLGVYRIPDPSNTGNWLSEEIWVVPLTGKRKQKLTSGQFLDKLGELGMRAQCRFMVRGEFVVWIDSKGRLMCANSTDVRKRYRLASGAITLGSVDEYGNHPFLD